MLPGLVVDRYGDVLVAQIGTAGMEAMKQEILDALVQYADDAYADKEDEVGADLMRQLERLVMLRSIDSLWVEHLTATEEMRQGIGLQAYGQQDPLVAYKREAHDMWGQLLANIRHQITHSIYLPVTPGTHSRSKALSTPCRYMARRSVP